MTAMIFGALGVAANILLYQQKSGKKLLAFKLISDILFALHYFFLNAYTAMCIALIAIVRELVFLKQNKNGTRKNVWLIVFFLCGIASAAVTWKGPTSILPALASAISIFSFWRGDPRLSRILAFPISGCMMTYDFTCGSVMGIVNETLTLISAAAGVIRFRREQNSCPAPTEVQAENTTTLEKEIQK